MNEFPRAAAVAQTRVGNPATPISGPGGTPPVYRPAAATPVLPKMALAASPVYRPQTLKPASPGSTSPGRLPMSAPPVYRPAAASPVLPKMGPTPYRPVPVISLPPKSLPGTNGPGITQAKHNGAAMPPVCKPALPAQHAGMPSPPVFKPSNALPVLPKMRATPYTPNAAVLLQRSSIFPPSRLVDPTSSKAPRASSHAVVQRNLTLGTDDVFGKNDIDEADVMKIETMCKEVGSFLDKAQTDIKLLHIGVGVGNPGTAFGNPSASVQGGQGMVLNQSRPKFIDKLLEAQSTAAAIVNFNSDSAGNPVETGNLLSYPVDARFPLNGSGPRSKTALQQITALKNKATHFSIMNSVSQNNYESLVKLAAGAKQKGLYLKSYAETGEEEGHFFYHARPVQGTQGEIATNKINFSVSSDEDPFATWGT